MFTVHESNKTNFNSCGLEVIDDIIISSKVEWGINKSFIANITITCDELYKYKCIKNERIIMIPTPIGEQPFRIIDILPVDDFTINVFCRHVYHDLQKRTVLRCKVDNAIASFTLNKLKDSLDKRVPHIFNSDITTTASLDWVRKKGLDILLGNDENSFINKYGGELNVNGWNIEINKRIGKDRGFTAMYSKNIVGFQGNISFDNMVTRIIPVGFDGITISQKYIDSPNINRYADIYSDIIKFEDIKYKYSPNNSSNEGFETMQEVEDALIQASLDYFINTKCDLPQAIFDVNILMLKDTNEYKDTAILEELWLGDDITIDIPYLNLKLKKRMISYTYNSITKMYESIILGDSDGDNFFSQIDNKFEHIPDRDEIDNKLNQAIEQAFNDANDLIQSGGKNSYVKFLPNILNPSEILLCDDEDISKAVYVVRLNKNGLGVSTTGFNGNYQGLLTEGKLVLNEVTVKKFSGDLILANSINAEQLSIEAKREIRENLVTETKLNVEIGKINLEVSEKVNDLETSTNEKISKIEQTSNSISQSVEKVEDNVRENSNKISIAEEKLTEDGIFNTVKNKLSSNTPENLIKNSLARLGHKFWNTFKHHGSGYVLNNVGTNLDNTRHSLQFTVREHVGTRGGLLSHSIPVKENTKYTLSGKMETHRGDDVIIECLCWNKIINDANISPNIEKKHVGIMKDSQNHSFTFTTPSGTKFINIYFWGEYLHHNSTWNYAHYWIYSLRLNEGEISYPWAESNTFSESSISQLADEVEIKVNKNNVVSSINLSSEGIKINSNKVDITGLVKFSDLSNSGSTTINGDNIKTGTLRAMDLNTCNFRGKNMVYIEDGGTLSCDGYTYVKNFSVLLTHPGWDSDVRGSFDCHPNGIFHKSVHVTDEVYARGMGVIGRTKNAFVKISSIGIQQSNNNYLQLLGYQSNHNFGVDLWYSDEKLKENIKIINNSSYKNNNKIGLNLISSIEHYQYNYRKSAGLGTEKVECGYIANQLQRVNSSLVREVEQGDKSINLEPRASMIIPNLSLAIQEQQNQIDSLKQEIRLLKSIILDLK